VKIEKILLISDTHGDTSLLENEILPKYANEVQLVIHLGDFAYDLLDMQKNYPNLPMVGVDGAFEMKEKAERIITVGGDVKRRILLLHGHTVNVKFGLERIVYHAQEREVDACFFGHTHVETQFTKNGIFFMNPGSLTEPRGAAHGSFGLVTISSEGEFTGKAIKV